MMNPVNRTLLIVVGVLLLAVLAAGAALKHEVEKTGELSTALKQRDADLKSMNEQIDAQKKYFERIEKIISALDDTKAVNEARANDMHKIFLTLRADKQMDACLDLRLPDGFVMRLRSAAGENADSKTIPADGAAQRLPQASH